MTLKKFIKKNRKEIDECIKRVLKNNFRLNDKEREIWILNDESLYFWAKSEHVHI